MSMRCTTKGEELFVLIRDKVVSRELAPPASNMKDVLQQVSGSRGFSAYVLGAIAVHAVRRLMRYWDDEKPNVPAEHMYRKKVSRFVTDEMFPWLEQDLTAQIARKVIAAEEVSRRPISRSTRNGVLRQYETPRCYLCARPLNADAPETSNDFLTLDHLWPSSVGGDSIEDNLLPACPKCQKAKRDAFSWEWFNVHNLVLPRSPSDNALEYEVSPAGRIARQYYRVMQECDDRGLTLKRGFEMIGTIQRGQARSQDGCPVTFFDIFYDDT